METPKNFISVTQVSRSSVCGFAMTSTPSVVSPAVSGPATPIRARSCGGVKSKDCVVPALIRSRSIFLRASAGSLRRPAVPSPSPGNGGTPK